MLLQKELTKIFFATSPNCNPMVFYLWPWVGVSACLIPLNGKLFSLSYLFLHFEPQCDFTQSYVLSLHILEHTWYLTKTSFLDETWCWRPRRRLQLAAFVVNYVPQNFFEKHHIGSDLLFPDWNIYGDRPWNLNNFGLKQALNFRHEYLTFWTKPLNCITVN